MSAVWRCPGQDTRYWTPEDIFEEPCPHCGQPVEFWKNDVSVRCPSCKKQAPNPKFDPGCAAWCSYAVQCLGPVALDYQRQPQVVRDRLNAEVRKALMLTGQQEALNRSLKAASYVKELVKKEGGDMLVAVAAALLHDFPFNPGENGEAHGETAEGIMSRLELEKPVIEEVQGILASLRDAGAGSEKTRNYEVVADAVVLARLVSRMQLGQEIPPVNEVQASLHTSTAKTLARQLLQTRS